tara:strand:- start:265 stop:879 length:615 start_codon:yes stop_codon:yes gene_type:complete
METKPVFSFCVRSLHPDITEQNIRNSLSSLATISSIDFVNKNTRPTYSKHENCFKMAFIHVAKWHELFSPSCVELFIQDLRKPEGVKVYYESYKYFVLRENISMKSKRDSRITFLERENAALYKEVAQLQEKVRNMRIASNTLTKKYSNPDAKLPLKKRLRNKAKNNVRAKTFTEEFDQWLYITSDEEDNIKMDITESEETDSI